MSKHNKRRNRAKETAIIDTSVQPEETVTQPDVNQTKSSGLTHKIAYLKQHWWAVGLIVFLALGVFGAGLKYLEDDARRVMADRSKATRLNPVNEGLLAKINPFLSAPMPSSTPQLSKEYLYAGSKLLAVEDANATAVPPTDVAVWRPSTGVWWVMGSEGSQQTIVQFGSANDIPAPGDYDGDGKTDFCVFRPSEGKWYIQPSSNPTTYFTYQFGQSGDIPVQADFDGDGKTDAAVYRNGAWYIQRSSDFGVSQASFGVSSDTPTPADFDGDGKADIALYRSSDATFYYLLSSQNNGTYQTIAFGQAGDKPVPGDYDGDGKADAAVWRADYTWHIKNSSDGSIEGYTFGDPNSDIYVHNDYDGDGRVDRAFWRPSEGKWYITHSSDNTARIVQWGAAGDIPVPAFYRR